MDALAAAAHTLPVVFFEVGSIDLGARRDQPTRGDALNAIPSQRRQRSLTGTSAPSRSDIFL